MVPDSSDILIWLLRATFAVLLVVSSAWAIRSWRSDPDTRLHEGSHVAMAAGMLYMTLPAAARPLPVVVVALAYLVLAAAIVRTGVRDLRVQRATALDACIGCAPPAAGSVGAAYMFLLPFPGGTAAAIPIALTFGVAAALRGGSAIACAIDQEAASSRWINPKAGGCGPSCCCAGSCSCGAPTVQSRAIAWRLAGHTMMNVAMAAMLVVMAGTGSSVHQHLG